MCRHRKEKKIRKEFKNILKQRRALRRERQQRENLVNLDLLCVFPSFEHHPRNTPDSLRIIKRFFPPQKFVRVMHSQRGWKRERKHLITDFCDDAFEKRQKEKFHWKYVWESLRLGENYYERKENAFHLKNTPAEEILWVSFNTAVVQPAFSFPVPLFSCCCLLMAAFFSFLFVLWFI